MFTLPAALSNRDFRTLMMGQLPADFADWLDFVAIGALLAFVWTVDPFVFALLAVSMGLPYLVVGLWAGAVVDRVNVKSVLILSNIGRGLVTAALFFAPDWGILLLLVALRSSVDTFFTPAKQAAIQTLTRPEERMGANGLSHAINQASKIVAPALGGALLIWVEPQVIFLLNAGVSFIAAGLLLRLSSLAPVPDDGAAETGVIGAIRGGLAEVAGSSLLRSAIWLMAAGYFAMFFYDTLIAPLTRDLGYSQTHLGFALAAVGAGGVVGAVMLGAMKDLPRPFLLIAAGSAIAACAVAVLGGMDLLDIRWPVGAFVGLFAILGVASALSVVPFRTVLQNTVAPGRMGRVTALSEALNTIALLTAPFIGAAIASLTAVGMAFICGGVILTAIAVKAMRMRNHR
ncbi:MFS transporter [Boseongicola sp. H5]|uniref:MFS transporter n=1 Tax=Boseongicola sp. H5 TaxID=2763261 RepID=UPI001D0BA6A3|nr:MFS transporter [Boseongicola sp. H5]